MAVPSSQYNNEYGIPGGLIFSYPVTTANGKYELVRGLKINDYSREKLNITAEELLSERKAIEDLL